MANALPKIIQGKIKAIVFKKADEFGYMECGRIESGKFLDMLVEDEEVGKVINQYMPKERVRTYIKDGILNAYTKAFTRKALASSTPEKTILDIYGDEAMIIHEGKGKQSGLFVLRSGSGKIYVVSGGTVLKWETALRKALDVLASKPGLVIDNNTPFICLKLSTAGQSLTDADKSHIISALAAVRIKAIFVDNNY